ESLRSYVDTLIAQLNQSPVSVTWIMGMLSTKEHDEVFKILLRPNDELYLVPVPDHSSAVPSELAQLAKNICPELSLCETSNDLSTALTTVFSSNFSSNNNLVVLCGSLYLVGNFLGDKFLKTDISNHPQ
ncbi:MAG: hypothetical protein AAFR83_27060, partial [Cyanobacteria bacterium J06629_18]